MRTEKQKQTQKRNWIVMQLRGIYCNIGSIARSINYDPTKAQDEIETMLLHMGVETNRTRERRMREELEKL